MRVKHLLGLLARVLMGPSNKKRMFGATYKPDKRDYSLALAGALPENTGKSPVRSDIIEDQGVTSACTAFDMAYVIEGMINLWGRDNGLGYIDIDPWVLWENQIRRRARKEHRRYDFMKSLMNKNGDSVHNCLMSVIENGVDFHTSTGKYHVSFENFVNISIDHSGNKLPLQVILDNIYDMQGRGVPMYTGSYLKTPAAINGWWQVTDEIENGHAYKLNGITIEKLGQYGHLIGPNSWGYRFGYFGHWKSVKENINKMFGPYVLTGMKVEKL